MTKEEAIQELIFNKEDDTCLISVEALDLAIKALEQQPSYEDCVSRAEVNKLYDEYRPRLATHVSEFGDKLKALPPVTPTFPKGATNGDMIKAMFPNYKETRMCGEIRYGSKEYVNLEFVVDEDWWNAPYRRGNKNG